MSLFGIVSVLLSSSLRSRDPAGGDEVKCGCSSVLQEEGQGFLLFLSGKADVQGVEGIPPAQLGWNTKLIFFLLPISVTGR